jgi:hypothetical protein
MRTKYLQLKDIYLTAPASLILGAAYAALQPAPTWTSWFGFSALFFLGSAALLAAWRYAGGGKNLAWMMTLALVLRLIAGIGTYIALPINGYNVPDDKAGFVFTDAHRRDDQAWDLAISNKSLLAAFDKSFYTDQYGGLLAVSSLAYRIFSPDAHRPLLIAALAALCAALGVPFLFKATNVLWDERIAFFSLWIYVLYPESVLTGGAQMREPFLLTFMAISFWGFAQWLQLHNQNWWYWIGAGMVGMLLISPGIALAVLVFLGGWLWLRGERARLSWRVIAAAGSVILIGVLFLAWSLSRQHDFSAASPLGIILNWFRDSVKWVIYQLERDSGQIQNVFSKMNPLAQFIFVVAYGIAQPNLPPAFLEPTTLTWHIIAIYRSIGWYLILPLLLYFPFAAWRSPGGPERRTWLWLATFTWIWILICAVRAGGDQWDNPRYRLIFLGTQAWAAGYAWHFWREHHDAWLPRIAVLEVMCVLLFGEWYLARYYLIGIHLPIMVMLSISMFFVAAILGGGWLRDHWQARKGHA